MTDTNRELKIELLTLVYNIDRNAHTRIENFSDGEDFDLSIRQPGMRSYIFSRRGKKVRVHQQLHSPSTKAAIEKFGLEYVPVDAPDSRLEQDLGRTRIST